VGFIDHPSIVGSGASPDGLVDDGLVEIKCPNTSTMLDWILERTVPGKYVTQMQWQMACTGAKFGDFVAYDPRLPAHLQLLIIRVPRDDAYISMLADEVRKFLAELEAKVSQLREVKL
jgi:hypothetical protein